MIQKKRINNDVFVRWGVFTPEGLPVDLTEVTSITIEARPQSSNGRYPMVSEVVDNFVEAYFLAKDQKVVGKYNLYLTYTIDDPNIIGGVATYTIDYCDAFELLPKSCFVDGEDDVDPVNIQGIIASFTYSMLTEEEKNDLASRMSGNSGAQNLSDLLDVTISNLEIDQILKYDGTKWVNATSTGGSSSNVSWGIPTSQYTPLTVNGVTRNLSLNNHTHPWDTITNRPLTDEQFQDLLEIAGLWKLDNDGNLYTERNIYSHGWISEYDWGESPTPPAGVYNLKDLLDVGITNPQEDNILRFNGSHWVNVPSSNVGTLVEWSSETDNYINLLVGDSPKSISLHGHKHEIGDINTLQDSLDFKQDNIPLGDIAQYYRGDKEWAVLNTDAVVESTNLYYTPERVIELTGGLYAQKDHTHAFNSLTGLPNTLDGYGIIDAYNKTEIDNLISSTSGFWVKSVGLEAPTGFIVSNSPIIYEGNIKLSFASGYSLPSNSKQYNWDLAFSDRHTHTNINVLNELTIDDVNNWNSIHEHLNDYNNPHQVSFRQLKNKPSTLLGYGITNAYNKTEVDYIFSNINPANKEVLDTITQEMLDNASREMLGIDSSEAVTDKNFFSALRVLAEILKNNETLKNLFLSKINPDTAQKLITFIEGIEVGTFTTGALGAGAAVKMIDGTSYAEVDNLTVRQKATFRELIIESLKHIGGQLVLTPARMKCVRVVDGGTYYKCYFDTGDGEVSNEFVAGDLARCQVFTGSGTKVLLEIGHFGWRDWINLSKTSAAVGSDVPEAGDDIVQLGNATDTTRQSAIILSTVGIDAPSWKQYSGINSFSLEGKETTVFSKLGNKIEGKTVFTSNGANVEDGINSKNSNYSSQPTSYKANDTWTLSSDTTVNGIAYKSGEILTATQDSTTFVQAHWVKKVRYTDQDAIDKAVDGIEIGGRNLFSVNDFVADNKARGYSTINVINYNGNIAYRSSNIVNNHNIPRYLQGKFEANTQYYLQFKINWESYTNSGTQYIFQIRYTDGTLSNLYATTSQTSRSMLTASGKTIDYITTTRQYDGTVVIYEVQIEKSNKASDWRPALEDTEREVLEAQGYMKARYIRDYINGSSANNTNHWNELKVFNKAGVNIAIGKIPTSNGVLVNPANLTDNILNNFTHITPTPTTPTSQYIQIDLGQVHYDIDYIHVWHYYLDGRTYNGTKTQISEDGITWKTIFDSAVSGTYVETEGGKVHTQRYASVMNRLAETEAKTRFQTLIDGGLIYTALMKLFDTISGDETAFISGKQGAGKNLPAFGAGGSYQDAIAGTAKAIIRHDGSSKFTDTEITGVVNATSGNFTGEITATSGTIEKLTMAPNGVIELPPTFTSRKGRINNSGIQLIYDGSNSQSIEWYTGLGTYSGRIAPNSQGHLSISSSFGVGIQSQLINIGTEAFAGNINIGSGLAEIDFNGSSINNIKEMTNIGYTSMASLTFIVPNNTSLILRHDTPLSILTSVGSNSFLKSIYMNNNNLLRDGTIKWILNRSTSGISIATDGNIRINSGDLASLQSYSLTPFIYSAGYWYKHSDHR